MGQGDPGSHSKATNSPRKSQAVYSTAPQGPLGTSEGDHEDASSRQQLLSLSVVIQQVTEEIARSQEAQAHTYDCADPNASNQTTGHQRLALPTDMGPSRVSSARVQQQPPARVVRPIQRLSDGRGRRSTHHAVTAVLFTVDGQMLWSAGATDG